MDLLFGSIDFKEKLKERDTQLTIALIVVFAVGFGGYKLYKWHTDKIQSRAQKDFSESIDIYRQALAMELGGKKDELALKDKKIWEDAAISFRTGFEDNKKSNLAPFFLAFESDSQAKLNKFDEAYKNLKEAIDGLSKNTPYYYLYSNKLALMEIDKKDVQEGIVRLNNLMKDNNNIFKDMTGFYLGEYYWSNNDIDKAKEFYQTALAYNSESTWGNLSKMRLERLG